MVTARPSGLGRLAVHGIEHVGVSLKESLPIVVAFPGTVYGAGSGFEKLCFAPLARGKRLIAFSGHSPFLSPIHVRDCARALAHLLTNGSVGQRNFLVDDNPVQWSALQRLAASALEITPKFLTLPRWLVTIAMGPIMAESLLAMDNVLSNAKLKALGFDFEYPMVDTGIPAVIAEFRNQAMRR